MGSDQQSLWHDTLEDAIRSAVDALGGPKRVGADLWPSRRLPEAARLLNHALDVDRPEKLSLGEVELIGRLAREAGCHTIATYLMRAWGYQDPQPVEPVDELAELQRAFMASVDQQKQILQRLEQLQSLSGPELSLVRKSGRSHS
jgi:hypothetical protein